MIEHEPIAERRLAPVELRIGKAAQHLAPRGLPRSKPRVQIPAKHAVLAWQVVPEGAPAPAVHGPCR